jgi:ABC-type transporter Mla maintaining outer membrane lipid asymmetry ATPase subunit MlaF
VNPEPIIQMRGVTVVHPQAQQVPVLSGVDWEVLPGDSWVIAGLQGSGKTLLLETAAGLHPFPEGEVQLFGHLVTGHEGDELAVIRRRVGLVFDGRGRLFGSQTVFENVALPLCYHGNLTLEEVTPEVWGWLERMNLGAYADYPAGRLGRAWAHRVALARALVLKPEVLMIDNPLAGLDAAHARWWRFFLGGLLKGHPAMEGRPMTLILATDAPRTLMGLGRRFAVTQDGHWRVVGDRLAFEGCVDPGLQELLHDTD